MIAYVLKEGLSVQVISVLHVEESEVNSEHIYIFGTELIRLYQLQQVFPVLFVGQNYFLVL